MLLPRLRPPPSKTSDSAHPTMRTTLWSSTSQHLEINGNILELVIQPPELRRQLNLTRGSIENMFSVPPTHFYMHFREVCPSFNKQATKYNWHQVNSFFPSCFSVQCCLLLATAPQQKPWSPHSRWKRFLFCLSLAGKVRGRRASGIVAGQLGNCNGTWPNPFIFLSLSSRRVENLESWLGSIMAKWEKSPGACIWQGLAKRVSYLNDWLFTKFKRAKSRNQNASWNDFKYTSNPFLPQFDHLLGKSSWLESARHHCTSQVLELPEGGNAIMIYILT